MTPKAIVEELQTIDEDILLADGFEKALIGYVRIFSNTVALYDEEKCIAVLMDRGEMTEEQAREYFEFNVVGAWVGDKTPAFATVLKGKRK